jgi:hypothetical protein
LLGHETRGRVTEDVGSGPLREVEFERRWVPDLVTPVGHADTSTRRRGEHRRLRSDPTCSWRCSRSSLDLDPGNEPDLLTRSNDAHEHFADAGHAGIPEKETPDSLLVGSTECTCEVIIRGLENRRAQNPSTDHEVVVTSDQPETDEEEGQPNEDRRYSLSYGRTRDPIDGRATRVIRSSAPMDTASETKTVRSDGSDVT